MLSRPIWRSQATAVVVLFVAFFGAVINMASAHELTPAIADFSANKDLERVQVRLEINGEAILTGIGEEHDNTEDSPESAIYDRMRTQSSNVLEAAFRSFEGQFLDGIEFRLNGEKTRLSVDRYDIPSVGDVAEPRASVLHLSAPLPAGEVKMQFGWNAEFGNVVVRVPDAENPFAVIVNGGEVSEPVSLYSPDQSFWGALVNYIGVGFEHIIPLGLDHILFVVGLFLLSTKLGPLLWQVTAFTLAHSVTLALGMLGIVNIPGSIVEPIIAASIVYVAVENILSPQMTRWRPIVVFLFGLLHGLGFAGVLTEFGIPESQFLPGLLGFNIGVELGQLAVIAICFALVGFWFGNKPWYRRAVVIPGSLAVAAVGLYWFLERTVL